MRADVGELNKGGIEVRFIERALERATVKKALLATLIFAGAFYVINLSSIGINGLLKITGGPNILDFEHGYSVERAYTIFEQLGEKGRAFYSGRIIPVDFLFAISYMFFYSAWMSFFIKSIQRKGIYLKWILCVPVLNMLSDWIENINIILMLKQYPERLEKVCWIGSLATRLKFYCVNLNLVCLTVLLFWYLIKKEKNLLQSK